MFGFKKKCMFDFIFGGVKINSKCVEFIPTCLMFLSIIQPI